MKLRFTLFRRGGVFCCQDNSTRQQTSLRTRDAGEAQTLLNAKNEAHRQPILNLHIARAYLSATDPEIGIRTWQVVMDEMAKTKRGPTLHRHHSAMRDKAFDLIRNQPLLETQPIQFMRVLEHGCVSTNLYQREHAHVFRCRKLDIEKRDAVIVFARGETFARVWISIQAQRFERFVGHLTRQTERPCALTDPFATYFLFALRPIIVLSQML
jgi:hypothetical protein